MRTSTGTIAAACALSATLLVAGCGGDSGKDAKSSGEVFLQPVAAQGPDPFTDSTATAPGAPPRVTRTPQSTPAGTTSPSARPSTSPSTGRTRAVSGATPGLYGGTARAGSCDVERQIAYLTADRAKARAFGQAEGISPGAIPGYLRGLTSVVLRADTQVTNHGFRDTRLTGFQSVLQAGTAVLVDDRGVPRVRCACGNPLKAGVPGGSASGDGGRSWSGYRPAEVVVVTPAPQVITNITIIDVVDNTWIERPLGHRGPHHDHVVPPPTHVTPTPVPRPSHPSATPSRPSPRPHESASGGISPDGTRPAPSSSPAPSGSASAAPETSPSDCTTPTVTVTPGATGAPAAVAASPGATGCPTATVTASPLGGTRTPSPRATTPSAEPPSTALPEPSRDTGSPDGIGPPSVPETPDLPDGGGLVPDDTTTGIFDSPTDVFDG